VEEEYLLQDLDDFAVCPSCRRSVRDEFAFCPYCAAELRHTCVGCHRMIDLRWETCAFCGATQYEPAAEPASIPAVAETARRGRRRVTASQLQSIDGGKSRDRSADDDGQHAVVVEVIDADVVSDDPPEPQPFRRRSGRDQG
jgi:RNA polymerase subunit RPABC4/transcription elongation factor Spt4